MKSIRWQSVPIKQVYLGLYDGPHATPKEAPDGPIFLGIKNLSEDGHLDFSEIRHIAEEDFPAWTRRVQPRPGDIVFSYEAALHRYAIIPDGFRGCLGRRLALIRPNPQVVDTHFLFFSFFSPQWRETIATRIFSGATVDRIPLISFPDFPIRLPPLPLQHTIAGILAAYDDLIENNARRIANLEERARLLYEEWFVRLRFPGHEGVKLAKPEMGMVPQGWEIKRLDEVCSITMGQSPSSEFYNLAGKGLPFHQGVADFGSRFPTDRVYCTAEHRIAHAGDILLSVRAPVGRLNLSLRRIVIGRGLCALRSTGDSQRFVFQQLKERFQEEDIIGNGAIFNAVTKDEVSRIQLLWPSPDVLSAFENYLQPIFSFVEDLSKTNTALRQTRDRLLPGLISGEIDVSGWIEEGKEKVVGLPARREVPLGRVAEMADKYEPEPVEREGMEWKSLWE